MSSPVGLALLALLLAILSTITADDESHSAQRWQSQVTEEFDHSGEHSPETQDNRDVSEELEIRKSVDPKQYLNELPCGTINFRRYGLSGRKGPKRDKVDASQLEQPLNGSEPLQPKNRAPDESQQDDRARLTRSLGGEKIYKSGRTFFMAMIRIAPPNSAESFCSGVLISDRHILTAAQCLAMCEQNKQKVVKARSVTASLGKNYERWDAALPANISSVVVHPDFDMCSGMPDYSRDIAVLTLREPVPLGRQVNRICLPEMGMRDKGIDARFYGYGLRSQLNDGYTQWRRVNTVEFEIGIECSEHPLRSTSGPMLCAKKRAKFHPCQGDSGGPLVVWRNDVAYLIGLNSLTGFDFTKYTDCEPVTGWWFPEDYYPSRYVSVKYLIHWIGRLVEGIPQDEDKDGDKDDTTTTTTTTSPEPQPTPESTTESPFSEVSTTMMPNKNDDEKRKSIKIIVSLDNVEVDDDDDK